MPKAHKVVSGDCCSSLAAQHGFKDYKGIYDAPENAKLKAARPNPNTLVVDDDITIPDKAKKDAPAPTGSTHKFVITKKTIKLRIGVRDKDGKPLTGKKYELALGGKKIKGDTGTGLIELEVETSAVNATLTVDLGPKPAPPAPPAAPAKPAAAYPPKLYAPDFRDVTDEALLGKEDSKVSWSLTIGGLPSFNTVVGVQQRLQNLGFAPFGEVGNENDPATQAAVEAYQAVHKLAKSGKATDIQADIKTRHDTMP